MSDPLCSNIVYWEEMKTDIKNSIIAYEFCQRNKSDNLSLVGLLLKYGQMLLWILLEARTTQNPGKGHNLGGWLTDLPNMSTLYH
jgi:hypothetical protein